MSRSIFFKEEQELSELRETEQVLLKRQKEYSEIPKKLAMERRERESTMPPLPEIEDRRRRREHENTVSRGEAKNILRDQNRSIMLLILLVTATAALVWWGLKLMKG